MIRFIDGDIFKTKADALVNTVNCVGVMGKGIALGVKQRWPSVYHRYKLSCQEGLVVPGVLVAYRTGEDNPRWIVNFPTKRHWKNPSRLEDIEIGLKKLPILIEKLGLKSIALPPLGCGNGGLEWEAVRDKITHALYSCPVDILIYGTPPVDNS